MKAGKTGFAHLFEHLMFEGSKNVPEGQFDLLLEAAGAPSEAYGVGHAMVPGRPDPSVSGGYKGAEVHGRPALKRSG